MQHRARSSHHNGNPPAVCEYADVYKRQMNRILNKVGFGIGLRVFETVNKDNIASYRSAMSASNVRILEELDGKDLYLEILKV